MQIIPPKHGNGPPRPSKWEMKIITGLEKPRRSPLLVRRCIRWAFEVERRGIPSVMALKYSGKARDEGGIGSLRGLNLMTLKWEGQGKGRDWRELFTWTASAAAASAGGLWWASYDGGNLHDHRRPIESCGIIGIVGKENKVRSE